mgnify:CR=1 FL=1
MSEVTKVKWKIKEILSQKNMTIYELAQKAEITDACIRNWYTKRNYNPSLVAIIKVCNALDIPVAELFREDGDEVVYASKEEKLLLSNWAVLNDKQRNVIKTLMETFIEK